MSSPLSQCLADLQDMNKPIIPSKLAVLSDLSVEEAPIFKEVWPNIIVERRRTIIGLLSDMLEENLELDFESIFRFCLNDVDNEVRAEAIEGLWECRNPSLIEPLVTFLKHDHDDSVRSAAAVALGKFVLMAELGELPSDNFPIIEETLISAFNKDPQIEVRCKALEALSSLSKPQVEELIRHAYQSDNLKLKASALFSMGRNCNTGWLPLLLKELLSSNPLLKCEAVRACAELEAVEAVPRLIQLLSDDNDEILISAIEALGQIGSKEAREAISKYLDSDKEAIQHAVEDALDEMELWDDPTNP